MTETSSEIEAGQAEPPTAVTAPLPVPTMTASEAIRAADGIGALERLDAELDQCNRMAALTFLRRLHTASLPFDDLAERRERALALAFEIDRGVVAPA